jgi:hypothetical protein
VVVASCLVVLSGNFVVGVGLTVMVGRFLVVS